MKWEKPHAHTTNIRDLMRFDKYPHILVSSVFIFLIYEQHDYITIYNIMRTMALPAPLTHFVIGGPLCYTPTFVRLIKYESCTTEGIKKKTLYSNQSRPTHING